MLDALRSDDNLLGEAVAALLLLVPWALAVWGMRRGYRRRRARDEERFGAVPSVDPPGRAPDGEALYTGTTVGGSRIDRVGAGGLFGRGPCRFWLDTDRLVFQRVRGPVVAVTGIRDAGVTGAHAGRVLAPGRIAIVAWTLGGRPVDTGFAFDDAEAAADFADRVAALARTPSSGDRR